MTIPITLHLTPRGWGATIGHEQAEQICSAIHSTARAALIDVLDTIERRANTDDVVYGPYAAPPEPKETVI